MREKPIPEEILDAFNRYRGYVLLIKGDPGTGKTIFSLELLNELSKNGNGIYLSTRVSGKYLYDHFPWLKGVLFEENILDTTKGYLIEAKDPKKAVFYSSKPDFIKTIYERIHHLEKPVTLVIDSWDVIFNDIKEAKDLEDNFIEISRDTETNVVMITEKQGKSLDYLVDGILRFEKKNIEGRRIRLLHIDKMRGIKIRKPSYVFTLESGRIKCFKPFKPLVYSLCGKLCSVCDLFIDKKCKGCVLENESREEKCPIYKCLVVKKAKSCDRCAELNSCSIYEKSVEKCIISGYSPKKLIIKEWVSTKDGMTHFSSGSEELDAILGGGYRRGSLVLIDVGEGVQDPAYRLFNYLPVMNFIQQGRGAIISTVGGADSQEVRNRMCRFVSEKTFDEYVRVLEINNPEKDQEKPYIVILEDDTIEAFNDAWVKTQKELRKKTGKPIYHHFGFDILEYRYGEQSLIEETSKITTMIKSNGDLGIAVTKPGLKSKQELANIASVHLKIMNIHGFTVFYGIQPITELYLTNVDISKGYPKIKLCPIV
ncbi:MAG: ATPase domain-containing protein [Candidatus Hydrothermarchaeota archaeon]